MSNNRKFQVYEAYDDGMLLFEADINELCNIFEKKPDYIKRAIKLGQMVDKMYNIVDPDNPVELKKVFQYGVYDMLDDECLVFLGTKEELLKRFEMNESSFFSTLCRKSAYKRRYLIEKI